MKLFSERSINMIKLYSWNNVFFSYFKKSIFFIFLPLAILSLFVFVFFLRSEENDVINNQTSSFFQTANHLESVFTDIENNHGYLKDSDDILYYCNNNVKSNNYPAVRNVLNKLDSVAFTSQNISNIHLYKRNDSYILSSTTGNSLTKFHNRKWYDLYEKTGVSDFIYYNKSENSNIYNDSLTISRGIQNNNEISGLVLYEIDIYTLDEILEQIESRNSDVFLFDYEGNIFYSGNQEHIGQNIDDVFNIDIKEISGTYKHKNMLYHKHQLGNSYTFVSTLNLNTSRNFLRIVGILVALFLVVLILSFIMSFYLSLQYYKSIVQITSTLRSDEELGEEGITENKYAELFFINKNIVSRLNNSNYLEKKLSEQLTSLKKAQFFALQSQLNPHFIYNTLNIINIMILKTVKKECEASSAVVILSQLLRNALDTKKYIVTVNEEIEYTKKYIMLQQLKYNSKIDVIWDIDDSFMTYNIIKFVFQPIVENAFEHGFSKMGENEYKRISFSSHTENDTLVFTISNNGAPIPEDTLADIRRTLNTTPMFEQKDANIGLVNVNHRIRLVHGEQYGCSITSDNTETAVKIFFPLTYDNGFNFNPEI